MIGAVEAQYPGKIALWAPGVGTQHGFTSDDGYAGFQTKTIEDNVRILQQITGRNIGIALHGSTGLPNEKLSAAAKCGVTKVNWSSESLYLRSMAAKQYYQLFADKLERKHPEWKNTAMDDGVASFVSTVYVPRVMERMMVLGGEGMRGGLLWFINVSKCSLMGWPILSWPLALPLSQ